MKNKVAKQIKSNIKSIEWEVNDNYIIGRTHKNNLKDEKIAAFDLDHTLIRPSNGKKFSDTDTDWIITDNTIKDKLQKLHEEKYYLVIISNQKGITNGKVDINIFKSKIDKIINLFGLDFVILCSIEDDLYRKPRTALWDEFIDGDIKSSFYCGDAAGFENDFSDSDLKFALNIGIEFKYVDDFIFGKKKKCIATYPVNFNDITNRKDNYSFSANHQEVIINVGLPGSGKSQFTKDYIINNGYVHVNQDTLKTKDKCLKLFQVSLEAGKSVVIDNVNISKDQRKVFLDIAKKFNVKCRCLHFITPKEICIHNAYFRNYITNGNVKSIPNLVFNIMNKKFQEPELSEGFYTIDKIEFTIKLSKDLLYRYTKFFY